MQRMDFKTDWATEQVGVCRSLSEAIASGFLGREALVSFAEAAPVLIAYATPDGRIRFANKAWAGWLSQPRSPISEYSLVELVEPAFRDAIETHLKAAVAGARVTFEMVVPCNGNCRTMRMTLIADRDSKGAVCGLFVLGEDLSEKTERLQREIADRARVELELAEKERLLSELIETAPTLVVLADDKGRILLFNRACEELTGYARHEVIGKDLLSLFVPPEWQSTVQARFADPFAPEVQRPHENPWLTKAGERRCIEWRCAVLPIDGADLYGVLGIGVDITERRLAERAAYQQQMELARVLRVNTMGEMAAALAHEINQPLAAILSYTQGCQRLVAGQEGLPQEVDGYLEKLAGQARRAGEIVQHIRRFIQKDVPLMTECDMNELVREAATFARAEAALHEVTVALDLAPVRLPVRAERIAIEQVILNLIHNSVEAMVGGQCARREVTVATGTRDGLVVVEIEDTGPGVSQEVRQRLFQAFVTTKRNGLGLGLSICHSIVKDHGGEMWTAEQDRAGAVFAFSLPFAGRAPRGDG